MFEPLDQSEAEKRTSSKRDMRIIWAVVLVVTVAVVVAAFA
jgi:hypothetical protein